MFGKGMASQLAEEIVFKGKASTSAAEAAMLLLALRLG
jgi:hypothetical protein